MAEQETKPVANSEEETAKPSIVPKIMIAGFVAAVVIAETLIFFFMVPSADDVAKLAEARLTERVEASMASDGEELVVDDTATKPFGLGQYGINYKPPGSDREFIVEFNLFGTIYVKDEAEMEELYQKMKAKIENDVMLEVRNATEDELHENQLGLIRRRILARVNEVLGEERQILHEVLIPGYRVQEA